MSDEGVSLYELMTQFWERASVIESERYPTRSLARLTDTITGAWELARWVRGFKEGAIAASQEEPANELLAIQCFASALASEMEAWVAIRQGDPDLAWVKLMDAHDYLTVAEQAGPSESNKRVLERLNVFEGLVFPPQSYVSSAILYKSGICTICGERFDSCPHEEGIVYCGRLCREIERRGFEALEVSDVDVPYDRRCRVTSNEAEGGRLVDVLTGETVMIIESPSDEHQHRGCVGYSCWTLKDV